MQIEQLKVQNMTTPLGICTKTPVFSYQVTNRKVEDNDKRNRKEENIGEKSNREEKRQGAYRILVSSDLQLLKQDQGDLWDSGIVKEQSLCNIVYKGKLLSSRQRFFWKVNVWDQTGNDLGWSEISYWEMGLFPEDWTAKWIGQGDNFSGDKAIAPMFVCDFFISTSKIKSARLYISGLGIFRASLNGKALSDTLFDPGECDATKIVYYVTLDVTDFLQEGKNTLGVLLGNGQYTNFQINPVMCLSDGTLLKTHRYQKNDGGFVKPGIAGEKKLIAQLEIVEESGERYTAVSSDKSWKWTNSPIVFQNWYGGEDYDATKEQLEWDTCNGNRKNWKKAVEMKAPEGKLIGREFPPIRIIEKCLPAEVRKTKNGNWLVDMGRNGAGFPEIRLFNTKPEQRGTWIRMYPAELLTRDREHVDQASCTQSWNKFYQCAIMDSYRIKGEGQEIWHPLFCYQGFQYLEIEGYHEELSKENFRYCIVRTENNKKGYFRCSEDSLNKINGMVEHSIESNMFSTFTDCPQIEKLGWIETSHLMFPSVASTYDIAAWMRKIIFDILHSQVDKEQAVYLGNEEVGYVPAIIPEYQRIVGLHRDPNWNGACIFTPWEYYQYYGDSSVLSFAYPVMKSYITYLMKYLKNGVLEDYAQMGEWGELNESTPKVLVATCSFYRMLIILGKIAGILGKEKDKDNFEKLALKTKEAFYSHPFCYDNTNGIFGNGSQASFGCVLYSGMVENNKKAEVVELLVDAVKKRDYHLSCGEVGLKQVFIALAENGKNDIVYKMIMNKTAPSYRFFADTGMTTLPEYWNCDELWQGMERSRNHAMMGHVKEWIYRYMLGVKALKPGFSEVIIKPWMPKDLEWMEGSVITPYGNITVKCHNVHGKIEVQKDIPFGIHLVVS